MVIDDIAAERGEVAADRARTALSGLFTWAIERGYCEINPTLNIGSRAHGAARDRVLTEAELVEVWRACEDDDYGRIVRLLILTVQRKSEIGDLIWPEVQKGRRQIDLLAGRTKITGPILYAYPMRLLRSSRVPSSGKVAISSLVAEPVASQVGPKRRRSWIPVSQQRAQRLASRRRCRRGEYMICGGPSSRTSTSTGSRSLTWLKQ